MKESIYSYYRSLPGGTHLSKEDVKFVHSLFLMWKHYYRRSLREKIYHFCNCVQKTDILKNRLEYYRMIAFNVRERNLVYPTLEYYIQRINYMLSLIRIGEEYRNRPEVLGIRVFHKESIGFARVFSFTTKNGETKVWGPFDWGKLLY